MQQHLAIACYLPGDGRFAISARSRALPIIGKPWEG